MYLYNTQATNEQHRDRLEKEAVAVMSLLGENSDKNLLPDGHGTIRFDNKRIHRPGVGVNTKQEQRLS